MKIKSIIIPSSELIFESNLDQKEFIQRLESETEPPRKGFKLWVKKRFEGSVSDVGRISITYGRGMRLEGAITPLQNGSYAQMSIGLPRGTLAFGLSFAWGTLIILLTGTIIIDVTAPHVSIIGVFRQLGVISFPFLFTYGIMLGNLWQYTEFIREYLEEHYKN